MSKAPDSAACRAILADGTVLTVNATRRARAGRADIKCELAGAPMLARRVVQVLRLARHTEARFDSRDQVVVSIDGAPRADDRGWELAAVLADRSVRGLWRPQGPVSANGWSDQWQLGRVDGHTLDKPAPHPGVLLGGPGGLAHLGALTGQPDAAGAVSTGRAWFPLHSGGVHDSLCALEVSVYPLAGAQAEEEDTIAVPGLGMAGQSAVRRALAGARHYDAHGLGRWRTVVTFGQAQFEGDSFELALVMADRIARGREFPARARLIATGCSSAWHTGHVENVEGRDAKAALMLRQAGAGDRILVPKQWENALAPGFDAALRQSGASVAYVDRIGII